MSGSIPPRGFVLICLALAACSGDAATVPVPQGPVSFEIVSGDDQTGVVGEKLSDPLRVRVVDATGKPLAGRVVNFRVAAGGGEVFAGAALSDAQGMVAERWTLGRAAGDSQRVEVRSVTSAGEEQVHAVFRARAVPGEPVSVSAGDYYFDALRDTVQLTARVRDRFSNLVPDAPLFWRVQGGDSTVVKVTPEGLAESRRNGDRMVFVRVLGTEALIRDTAQVFVNQVAMSLVVSPDTAVMKAGATRQFTAVAYDRNGQPLPAGPTGWKTTDAGVARVSSAGVVTAVAPGSAVITATRSGFQDTATVTVVP
ncbi:MAG TPA: Ig-like domain-containing protein [Longimicrobium sp.]|nr:Ig-like domain-containing protein [Longimicrobium sp.]